MEAVESALGSALDSQGKSKLMMTDSTTKYEFQEICETIFYNEGNQIEMVDPQGDQEMKDEQLKEEVPKEWICEVCTVLNPWDNHECSVCGQGSRPYQKKLKLSKKNSNEPDSWDTVKFHSTVIFKES